jgi:hypothetical protein
MNMTDMKIPHKSTDDVKVCGEPCECERSLYPYGLEGSLDEEGLNKLGIDISNVDVGEKIIIHAVAEITEVKQIERLNEGKEKADRSLRWQIQKIGIKFQDDFEESFDEAAKKKDE